LAAAIAGLAILSLAAFCLRFAEAGEPVATLTITQGDLKASFRENGKPPRFLSGVTELIHKDEPRFPAFNQGGGVGLNFEHIICGHKNPNNAFTPRNGKFAMFQLPDGKSVQLVRAKEDEPWAVSSTIKYAVTKPHYIEMDFRCVAHDKDLFGKRGYAILFFASYMNSVEDVALHFRGVDGPKQEEKWTSGDAPKGHADWYHGGTYRSLPAADLEYDANHNNKASSWTYDYPRFTKPYYFGKTNKEMVFILMFNKMYSAEDEIRFSLFKFLVGPKIRNPAWDFQYVIHKVENNKEYGFKARLVWKKFVSPDDCLKEYETWSASLGKDR
jgi:hypothetical protein